MSRNIESPYLYNPKGDLGNRQFECGEQSIRIRLFLSTQRSTGGFALCRVSGDSWDATISKVENCIRDA